MTESVPEPARRRSSGIAFRDTSRVTKQLSSDPSQKFKGVQSLTPKEQEAANTMQSLKERKKTSRRQPGTGGSSKGTGRIPGVPDESTVVSATSSEGTGTIPGVLDEEKVTSEANVILEWGFKQESEYSEKTNVMMKKLIMSNDEVKDSGNGDVEISDADKADAEKIKEVKDDAKKAELPPTSSSLSVLSDVEINSLLDIKIQYEVPHIQSPFVLTVFVLVIFKSLVLTPLQETPSIAPVTTLPPQFLRVAKLEKDVSELKKIDHSAKNLATLKLQVPTVVDNYLGTNLTMNENKPFNRNPANHALYHALMEALIEDENTMDKGVVDTETSKGKAPSKSSKTDKSATIKEPIKEPSAEVEMDDAANTTAEDVVHDANQPHDDSTQAKDKAPIQGWFKQPPRPLTPDPEWNKHQVIDHLTQEILAGPAYNLFKGTCTSSIELEYNIEECFKALTYILDWKNPEGDHCPFDLTKPLPLKGHPGHLTVVTEYFFNNDLKFLKSAGLKKTYTTSITTTKAARYEIVGIEDMTPTLWSTIKHGYDKDAEKGIKH
ncbi:hypothetical protein Tco_1011785 [Tanacetum coccineum]